VRGKSFCLEASAPGGLTTFVMPFSPTSTTPLDSLAGYPPWFVAACLTVVAVALVWLAAKLLKWSLYLLMALVLIAGVVMTIWLFFK
jgi:hypothetical protein